MIYVLYECDVCETTFRTTGEMPSAWGHHLPDGTRAWLVCLSCQELYKRKFNEEMSLWGE